MKSLLLATAIAIAIYYAGACAMNAALESPHAALECHTLTEMECERLLESGY